jgi:hypothetical protein
MADPVVQDWLGGLYSIYNLSGATFQDHNGVLFQISGQSPIGGSEGAGGRLTLTTALPVMNSATPVLGATSILYTPYQGDQIACYNGTTWKRFTFTELTNVTTATTVGSAGPLAVANDSNYDLFVWDTSLGAVSAGTLALTRGPVWTSATARSAGTALVMQNGVLVNSVAITNGPAIKCGRYVGTVHSNGTASIDWQYGAFASGWTPALHHVWNMYNRVQVAGSLGETGAATHTYNSTTVHQVNGVTNAKVQAVFGQNEDAQRAMYMTRGQNPAAVVAAVVGVGLDTTTAFSGLTGVGSSVASTLNFVTGEYVGLPGLGFHTFTANEACSTAQQITFFDFNAAAPPIQTGMNYLLTM